MIPETSTIAAVLTPIAPGAIGVIGLAGGDARAIVLDVCRRRGGAPLDGALGDRPRLVRIVDGDETIDDVVVVETVDSPNAHFELCSHGGVRVVRRILALLEKHGARPATGGEFVDRLGCGHPIRRDVDKVLIRSGSRRMTAWLLSQRERLPAFLDEWGRHDDQTMHDFSTRTEVAVGLVRGLRIAIVGPPNAGKSTLANRLIGHDRIITSQSAGTTRDWVDETAFIDGWPVTLTDTAGIRATECGIETEAIRRGTDRARTGDLALIVLDATEPAAGRDQHLQSVDSQIGAAVEKLVVLNKVDCAAPDQDWLARSDALPISARTGEGIDALECRLATALRLDELYPDQPTGFLPEHLQGRTETASTGPDK